MLELEKAMAETFEMLDTVPEKDGLSATWRKHNKLNIGSTWRYEDGKSKMLTLRRRDPSEGSTHDLPVLSIVSRETNVRKRVNTISYRMVQTQNVRPMIDGRPSEVPLVQVSGAYDIHEVYDTQTSGRLELDPYTIEQGPLSESRTMAVIELAKSSVAELVDVALHKPKNRFIYNSPSSPLTFSVGKIK